MREQFEKLPEISELIKRREVEWCDKKQTYVGDDNDLMFFAQGAWYTYQEQQKKIDALEKEVDIRKQGASVMSWHREQILDMCESALRCSESVELNAVIGEIKELLK